MVFVDTNQSASRLNWFIPSCFDEIDGICREARILLERYKQDGHCFAVELLLREFINNAIIHGHQMRSYKRVQVMIQIGRKWIQLKIADEGTGFKCRYKQKEIPDLTATSGRGLCIASCYCHKIQRNRMGNHVTLWIKKRKVE